MQVESSLVDRSCGEKRNVLTQLSVRRSVSRIPSYGVKLPNQNLSRITDKEPVACTNLTAISVGLFGQLKRIDSPEI